MKILLTGFFGERNLGDETILQAILGNLPQHHQLWLTCGNYPSISGPKLLKRRGFRAWAEYLAALKECDRTVFSGGILQDWSFEGITFFALRILAASIFKAEPSLWGAGLGPVRRLAAHRITAKALSRVKVAWLRDSASLDFFNDSSSQLGKFGSDWSWFFPVSKSEKPYGSAPIGVNLRPWAFSSWQRDVEAQQKHIDRHVIGIPARPEDQQAIKQLFHKATLLFPETFSAAGDLCRNLSYGIAMRYHIALAMLRAGLPVKLVAYDDKVRNLATEAGVTLLSQDRVSGFKTASIDFLQQNSSRFAQMQSEFKAYFSCP